ncbi:unnamed protein product [Sympodiomycopsis kandeliae]
MVFRVALARATAPVLRTQAASSSVRCLSTSAIRRSDDHHAPIIQGPGGKTGEIPSDYEQATGLERFELMGRMEGVDVFDQKPLQSDRIGTLKNPIIVNSLFPSRVIGCTGSPAGSHDVRWMNLKTHKEHHRCPECGSVYHLNFITPPEGHGEGHH